LTALQRDALHLEAQGIGSTEAGKLRGVSKQTMQDRRDSARAKMRRIYRNAALTLAKNGNSFTAEVYAEGNETHSLPDRTPDPTMANTIRPQSLAATH
jgi:hypothetical protein